jgi:hypothetical protein
MLSFHTKWLLCVDPNSEWWQIYGPEKCVNETRIRNLRTIMSRSPHRNFREKLKILNKSFSSEICTLFTVKVKVQCTLVQTLRLCTGRTAHRGSRGIALPFHDHSTRRGWGVNVTPWPLFTPGKTRYPLYRRLGGPQGRCGQVRKISPPPGFDPRTVQLVAQLLYRMRYPAHCQAVP